MKRQFAFLLMLATMLIASGAIISARQALPTVRFSLGDRKVIAAAPPGWRAAVPPPGSGIDVVLNSARGEIGVRFAPAGEGPAAAARGRSQRVGQLADRFAATWKLPLSQWNAPQGAFIARDAFRPGKAHGRYVASGHGSDFEFAAFGTIATAASESDDVRGARLAVGRLLASARYTSPKKNAPLVPSFDPATPGKVVSNDVDARFVQVTGAPRLKLPDGRVPFEMILPGVVVRSSPGLPSQLDLVEVATPGAGDPVERTNLSLEWVVAPATSDSRRQFVRRWQGEARRWTSRGGGTGRERGEGVVQDLPGTGPGVLYKRRTGPRGTDWLFLSDRLTLHGRVTGTPGEDALQRSQMAFEQIRDQLSALK